MDDQLYPHPEPNPQVKKSFGERMAEARKAKREKIKENITEKANEAINETLPTQKELKAQARSVLYQRLQQEREEKERANQTIKELEKRVPKKNDQMSVLDPDPKGLSSAFKALIGIGTLMIIIAPFVIVFFFLNQIKEWLGEHWQNILNVTVLFGAIIGLGNILFDIFSRLGIMRWVYTWIGINIARDKSMIKEEKT